jgi:hypothetical protein
VEVVELYSGRFAIELAFRDLKNHFGLGHYQARSVEAATRHVTLCLVAYTWSQLQLLTQRWPVPAEPWRPPGALATTGQLRRLARRESQIDKILLVCQRHGIPHKKLTNMRPELNACL